MADDNSEHIDLLLTRYGQVDQKHTHTNAVIHRTFYLSLVFSGALLGFIMRADGTHLRAILCLFATGVFIAVKLWTETYLNGRSDYDRQRDAIIAELQEYDYDFDTMSGIAPLFPDNEVRADWENKEPKNQLIRAYYVGTILLSGIATVAFLVVFLRV